MKNKGIRTITAGVLAVSVVMSTAVSVVALEPSPDGTSFRFDSAGKSGQQRNCAKLLDWLGITIPRHFDSQAPYKVNILPESDPNYWQAEWETQVYNYKMYVTIQLCTHRKLGTPRRVLVLSYWGFILRQ